MQWADEWRGKVQPYGPYDTDKSVDLGEGGYDAVANSVGGDGSADDAGAGEDDDTKQYEARKGRLAWLKLLQTFPPYLQS